MNVGVHVCLFVCTMCPCPWRPGEGAGSPGSGVTVVVRNEPRSFARAASPLNLWVICPGHSMFYLFILNASRLGGCNSILGSDSPKVAFPWLLGAVKNWKGHGVTCRLYPNSPHSLACFIWPSLQAALGCNALLPSQTRNNTWLSLLRNTRLCTVRLSWIWVTCCFQVTCIL